MERKLAAILAADIVGYTRIMGMDEAGTLQRITELRSLVLDPLVAKHNGRVFKTVGDGLLIEFSSVVDALLCAVDWHNHVAAHQSEIAQLEGRLAFRIGINLGDVILQGDDIFGDGVNIASRLENIADPGQILISRTVYDHVKGKVKTRFEDLGQRHLKNVADPVQVFQVSNTKAPDRTTVAGAGKSRARLVVLGGLAALLGMVGAGLWWLPEWQDRSSPDREPSVVQSERPSIAVLPFQNLSETLEQGYFADGMAEDLITSLSKLSGLDVSARSASFKFRDTDIGPIAIGKGLNVAYLLDGSVRRAGDRVRINAVLIDATTGKSLWAERYDSQLNQIFDLQDKVSKRIVEALSVELGAEESELLADHGTKSVEAHDAFLKAQHYAAHYTAEGAKRAIAQYEKALSFDPNYSRAAEGLERVKFIQNNSGLQ